MEKNGTGILEQYTGSLSHRIEQEYHIGEELYRGDIKRGLRNSDGTGVPIGVTRVGSVLGYMIEDGVRIPVPGQLYYRGIELNEIVEMCIRDRCSTVSGMAGVDSGHDILAMGYDQVKFLKPVFFGDTITATYWITEVNEARRKTTGQCVMTNQRGETVLTCLHYMKVIDPVEEGKGP